jgi:hypothetical protein
MQAEQVGITPVVVSSRVVLAPFVVKAQYVRFLDDGLFGLDFDFFEIFLFFGFLFFGFRGGVGLG